MQPQALWSQEGGRMKDTGGRMEEKKKKQNDLHIKVVHPASYRELHLAKCWVIARAISVVDQTLSFCAKHLDTYQ